MTAKIKSISVSGIRTLDDFKLDLNDGLTVLIGENGSGKSTIVEACELLRRVTNQNFLSEFNQIHGGEPLLLRKGAADIKLGTEIVAGDWKSSFQISFGRNGIYSEKEAFEKAGGNERRIYNFDRTGEITNTSAKTNRGQSSSSSKVSVVHPAINLRSSEFMEAVRNIDVQVSFASTAYWLSQSQGGRLAPMRDSVTIEPTDRLERLGINLPNAFNTLRTEYGASEWDHTMDLVRLGLGQWVESVNARPDAGGGKIALWIKVANVDKQIPSGSLSDGQLAYLAFVALARLPTPRSLLVFDEIETHLHPLLLPRVMSLIRSIAERTPVLLTTHSRRVLDDLDEPARSVRVLELDEESLTTKFRRLDEAKLKVWLDDYDGLGHLLDAGYPESMVQAEADEGR